MPPRWSRSQPEIVPGDYVMVEQGGWTVAKNAEVLVVPKPKEMWWLLRDGDRIIYATACVVTKNEAEG